MITINLTKDDLRKLDAGQSFEFVVDGERCATLSFNEVNFGVQVRGEVNRRSIANSPGSFFLRKDYEKGPLTVERHKLEKVL